MATEQRTVAVGIPQVFRAPIRRSFLVAPGAGGSVLLEYSNDGVNYTAAPQGVSASSYSLCPDTYGVQAQGYVRATALTAAALAFAMDVQQIQGRNIEQMTVGLATLPIITQTVLTTEQIAFSMRFPAGSLPLNFLVEADLQFSASNNVNVKTLKSYFGPTGNAGTALASMALTSLLNGRLQLMAFGGNDGVTIKGGSVGSGFGQGGGAVALVSTTVAAPGYTAVENELCITCTKATAADAVSIDRAWVRLVTQ
jgi:hypothetical protein